MNTGAAFPPWGGPSWAPAGDLLGCLEWAVVAAVRGLPGPLNGAGCPLTEVSLFVQA